MLIETLSAQAQGVAKQAREVAAQATDTAQDYVNGLDPVRGLIVEHFGQPGLIAAYLVLAALILFIATRVFKLAFSTVKYLVLPAVALAFIGSLFLSWSFFALLPVTITACSLVLVFKG